MREERREGEERSEGGRERGKEGGREGGRGVKCKYEVLCKTTNLICTVQMPSKYIT